MLLMHCSVVVQADISMHGLTSCKLYLYKCGVYCRLAVMFIISALLNWLGANAIKQQLKPSSAFLLLC